MTPARRGSLAPRESASYNRSVPPVPIPPTTQRSRLMTHRFLLKATLIAGAIATALILTTTRPSPQGLVPFGVGQAEVRAAPGTAAAAKAKGNYDLSALRVTNWAMGKVRDS